MTLLTFISKGTWSIDTKGVDGTRAMAASFIILAFILHPVLSSAFKTVRAHRAWRAIEQRQTVEITQYSLVAEVCRGRGKWDAARIITVLLAVSSVASCGLELSLGLAFVEGDAEMLNRPPPVVLVAGTDKSTIRDWQVIPKADFDCEDPGSRSLSNVHDSYADSMYNVIGNGTCHHGPVNGKIRVASWSSVAQEAPAKLYYLGGDNTTVGIVQCADSEQHSMREMYHGGDIWGNVVECTNGPELSNVRDGSTDSILPPPAILLTRSDGKVYIIVEETIIHPSFMYSVWTAGRTYGSSTELNHEFHIAATTRIAQAVVTAVVHGKASGQYSFELVRMWSKRGHSWSNNRTGARPFGEHHTNDFVKIENLETIACGLESNVDSLLCLAYLTLLTLVGLTMSLCLRSGVVMDVYDRDELFRAVALSGVNTDTDSSSGIRVFVRKEDTGNVSIIISDKNNAQTVHPRIRMKGAGDVVGDIESSQREGLMSHSNRVSRVETSRTVWVPEGGSGVTRQCLEPTCNLPTFVGMSLPPIPPSLDEVVKTPLDDGDDDVRGARVASYPGSTWGRPASTVIAGCCDNGDLAGSTRRR